MMILQTPITFSVYSKVPFHGRKMANGVRYNHYKISAAGSPKQFGKTILIEYKGRKLIVTVTDKIHPRFYNKRIDLSGAAWDKLVGTKPGLARGSYTLLVKGRKKNGL